MLPTPAITLVYRAGMLSSWMRSHYPHLVFASVASSAPVRFDRIGPSFFPLTTAAAAAMVPSCPGLVRAGFQALLASPLPQVVEAFGLCPGAAPHRATLTLWTRNAFVTAAMGNYPYRSDLFGKGLSAWPLRVACEALELGEAPALERLARALNTYYNASGTVACHMVPEEYRSCADQTGCGSGTSLWGQAWDHEVLACQQCQGRARGRVRWQGQHGVWLVVAGPAWGMASGGRASMGYGYWCPGAEHVCILLVCFLVWP